MATEPTIEPIQRDRFRPDNALCNSPELEEICPVCEAPPGFLCRSIVPEHLGERMLTFHRGRTALTWGQDA